MSDDIYTVRTHAGWFALLAECEDVEGATIAGPCKTEEAAWEAAKRWLAQPVVSEEPRP